MMRRYAVLDANGVKLNTITADEELIKTDWWPGYGAALVDEGEVEPDPPKPEPLKRPDSWCVIDINIAEPLLVGDRIDLKSGEVTRRVEIEAVEVALDEIAAVEKF
jgi:hypothetical protein